MLGDCLVVIPARMDSKRLPGKPLRLTRGKPLIQVVYENAKAWGRAGEVIVATDSDEITRCVMGFGGAVQQTRAHPHGTSRVFEIWHSKAKGATFHTVVPEYTVNLQCDEPDVTPDLLDLLVSGGPDTFGVRTLSCPLDGPAAADEDTVKVVAAENGRALYFTREPIRWAARHVGVYAFSRYMPEKLATLKPCHLSERESLEQLEWLNAGIGVRVIETRHVCRSVNTEADLAALNNG